MSLIDDIPFPACVRGMFDDCYIIKFFKEKWQRDYFLAGKLYMRAQTDFNKDELGEGKSDCTEGADTIVMPLNDKSFPDTKLLPNACGDYYAVTIDHKIKPNGYVPSLFMDIPASSQKRKVFCLYSLWMNREAKSLCNIDSRMYKNFGEHCAIISDFPAFLRRLEIAGYSNTTITTMNCGFVEYTPESEETNVRKGDPYIKSARLFGYQYEFRICAETDNSNLLELDLGAPLTDIVVPFNAKTFAVTAYYNGKGLSFDDEK